MVRPLLATYLAVAVFPGTMLIRIVIQRSPVRSNNVLPGVWKVCRQLGCQLLGHRSEIEIGSGTLALKCDRCGWKSPGWDLDSHPTHHSPHTAGAHLGMIKSPSR